MDRKYVFGLAGLAVVLIAGAGVALIAVGPKRLADAMNSSAGDISSAATKVRSKPVKPAESAHAAEPGPYEPTSEYIEPGLDPDVTTFAMDKGGKPVDPNLPEMLSEAAIQQVSNQHQRELIGCYAQALKDDSDLAGRVFFNFGVAPDGHVAMVRVTKSGLRSKSTEDCFVDKARRWRFPATRRQVLTRFDTNFNFVTR